MPARSGRGHLSGGGESRGGGRRDERGRTDLVVSCRRCRPARPPSVRPPWPSRPPDAETKEGSPVSQVQVTSASRTASSRTCASTPALFRLANRTSQPLAPTSSVSPGARACLTQGRGGQRRAQGRSAIYPRRSIGADVPVDSWRCSDPRPSHANPPCESSAHQGAGRQPRVRGNSSQSHTSRGNRGAAHLLAPL